MKRLIVLTYDYPPNNGGIARLCGEIVNCCKDNDLAYLVVTSVQGDCDEENVTRIRGKRGLLEIRILHYLRHNLKPGDVILTGTYHPDGIIGLLSGYPTYYLAHGAEYLPGRSAFRKYIWAWYRRLLLSRPSGIIANSSYTAGLVKRCCNTARVDTIPLAVDHNRFHPTQPKIRDGILHICTVSRLEKFKAQDFLIKTVGDLPMNYRERISVEIAGKGSYKPMLESLVSEYNLRDTISFVGFVSDKDLCDFYSRNDLFVLLTREEPEKRNVEGFGLVFLEAQACATACIGTRSGGIPDAVKDGDGGWLIEQDNANELRALLMRLIDNIELTEAEGKKARQRIERDCTWSTYFQRLLEVIE